MGLFAKLESAEKWSSHSYNFLIKFLENTSMKEEEIILGFYAVSTGNWLQKFQRKKSAFLLKSPAGGQLDSKVES